MPRKAFTSKEAIVEGAFGLIRAEGHESFTARRLAAALGCSTQPIMYQFPNLSELRALAYERADRFHTEYLLSSGSFPEMGLRYIRFAAEEPFLFRFLFQSGRFDGKSLPDLIRSPDVGELLSAAAAELKLPDEAAAAAFEVLFAAVHGYASLIANNAMRYDPEAIRTTLFSL